MTAPTDFRAQRYAATKSAAWLAGRKAYSVMGRAEEVCPYGCGVWRQDFLSGWQAADDDYEFDREKHQPIHRRPSPMSALERNRP